MNPFHFGILVVVFSGLLVVPGIAQYPEFDASNNYGADFYAPSFEERTYAPPPVRSDSPLNSQAPTMPQYRIDGSVVGEPTFDQQFRWQQEEAERRDRRNSRLQQLYQNQKSIACGPPMSPRAREGC